MRTRLLLALPFLAMTTAAFSADPELPFLAAARKREEATRAVEFVVKLKQAISRGALSPELPPDMPRPASAKVLPNEDTVVESTSRLLFDSPRIRLEYAHPIPPTLKAVRNVVVQNEHETKVLVSELNPQPNGLVSKPLNDFFTPWTDAIVWNCRLPSYYAGQVKHRTLEPTGSKALVDGIECEGYRFGEGQTFWADPKRDYIIVRCELTNATFPRRHDIRYQKHPTAGWLPSDWTITERRKSGDLRGVTTGTVEIVRVGEKFADDLFTLSFPVNTHVYNPENKKEYIVGVNGEELPMPIPVPSPKVEKVVPWNFYHRLGVGLMATGCVLAVLAVGRRVQLRRRNNGTAGSPSLAT